MSSALRRSQFPVLRSLVSVLMVAILLLLGVPAIGHAQEDRGRGPLWDVCADLSYAVSPAGMSVRDVRVLRKAMATVSRLTGARWRYVGTTSWSPRPNRIYPTPDVPAPLVVGFTTDKQVPALRAGANVGGFAHLGDRIVYGFAWLDKADWGGLSPDMRYYMTLRALGQALGLKPSRDRNELMHGVMTASNMRLTPDFVAKLRAMRKSCPVPTDRPAMPAVGSVTVTDGVVSWENDPGAKGDLAHYAVEFTGNGASHSILAWRQATYFELINLIPYGLVADTCAGGQVTMRIVTVALPGTRPNSAPYTTAVTVPGAC